MIKRSAPAPASGETPAEARPAAAAADRHATPDLASLLDAEYTAMAQGARVRSLSANAPAGGRAVAPVGPGSDPGETQLPPPPERSEEQKAAILARINADWLNSLHQQIADLYGQVSTEFMSPPSNAEHALAMLREARQLLFERPEEYASAEYRVGQVRAALERTLGSRRSSRYYGPRIFLYELLWVGLMLAGIVFANYLAAWVGYLANLGNVTITTVLPFWSAMMWGGIGGVVGAMYHLWWHVAERQDFDGQYLMWYLVQPVMGMILGGIIFLVMAGGFLVLQVNLASENASTAAHLLPYLAAVLAGFRQNFVYEQLDRLIALFTPAGAKSGGDSGSN